MAFCFLWLNSSVGKKYAEELMSEHFKEVLNDEIDKIDCYAEAVGKEFRPQLACNYKFSGKSLWAVKHIDRDDVHAPIWAIISSVGIDEISFERNSPSKVDITVKYLDGNIAEKLVRSDIYNLNAIADAISNGQPR